ncbi:hypothetical protein F3J27_03580 [Enterobacter sp. Ap-916]|uniref:hypothetical protein n=1 Tax=unclassified Enterobacter TaxID=2608935 RepID=UPI001423457A|nr:MULTISPECIES: hypothetical protein [unclassified Enterobacter]NIF57492.1 hypothetical protein [Enterobacter sp. Ap-867]NIG28566.1 hypothetical protein [Enterobacter sp. Ap-916]
MSKVKNYLDPESLVFERKKNAIGEFVLVGEMGEDLRVALPGSLTDSDAAQVVSTINRLYSQAYEHGKQSRSREIANLLGIQGASRDEQ